MWTVQAMKLAKTINFTADFNLRQTIGCECSQVQFKAKPGSRHTLQQYFHETKDKVKSFYYANGHCQCASVPVCSLLIHRTDAWVSSLPFTQREHEQCGILNPNYTKLSAHLIILILSLFFHVREDKGKVFRPNKNENFILFHKVYYQKKNQLSTVQQTLSLCDSHEIVAMAGVRHNSNITKKKIVENQVRTYRDCDTKLIPFVLSLVLTCSHSVFKTQSEAHKTFESRGERERTALFIIIIFIIRQQLTATMYVFGSL